MRLFRTVLAASLGALAACGSDAPTEPKPVATAVEIVAPVTTTTPAGIALTAAPTFVVKDQKGRAMSGVPVTVAVTAGGGTIANAAAQSSAAPAPVGIWTLGQTAGVNTLTVTAAGLTPATISITGKAGDASALRVVSGTGQSALAGTALGGALKVQATDQFGNVVENQPTVSFTVVSGGGTLAAATAAPGADGLVTVPTWTLGRSATAQQIRAAVGSYGVVIDASVQTSYNIDVRFFGSREMTPDQKALFTTAAARIRGAVIGQLSAINLNGAAPDADCGATGVPPFTAGSTTDGLIIYATIDTIDGPSKILARGGPCYIRTGVNPATIIGVMSFDKDDIASLGTGQVLQDVITHEMLHVVGVGSLWNYKSLLSGYNTTSVAYIGANGVQGCQATGGVTSCATTVPVENSGGAGTMNSHWRETTFRSELMTGYAENGPMPLSVMTIRSMMDLGYTVNLAAADPYSIYVGSLRAPGASGGALPEDWEGDPTFRPITLQVARERAAARAALRAR